MAKPMAKVLHKPPQQPKYNVLGTAVGGAAKALDNRFTGGLGQKIWTALTGSGDYVAETKEMPFEVSANTVVHPTLVPAMPNISNDGGMVRVRHREFINTILINDTGQANGDVTIQPGSARAFPWLNALGARFQQYKVLGGVFEYVTLCGNAVSAAVPALGQITLVAQYDISRGTLSDEREILNTYYANSGVISADLMMPLECETTEQPCGLYFVRDTDKESQPQDLRWYDFARLEISIRGAPKAPRDETYVAGQLWFTYDILLLKPVVHVKQEFPVPFSREPTVAEPVVRPGSGESTSKSNVQSYARPAAVLTSRGWVG